MDLAKVFPTIHLWFSITFGSFPRFLPICVSLQAIQIVGQPPWRHSSRKRRKRSATAWERFHDRPLFIINWSQSFESIYVCPWLLFVDSEAFVIVEAFTFRIFVRGFFSVPFDLIIVHYHQFTVVFSQNMLCFLTSCFLAGKHVPFTPRPVPFTGTSELGKRGRLSSISGEFISNLIIE